MQPSFFFMNMNKLHAISNIQLFVFNLNNVGAIEEYDHKEYYKNGNYFDRK
jgi:hypothetical protein